MAAGARQQLVVKALFRDGKTDVRSNERGERSDRNAGDRGERNSNDRSERNQSDRSDRGANRNERTDRTAERAAPQAISRPMPTPTAEPQAQLQTPQTQPQRPQASLEPRTTLEPQAAVTAQREPISDGDLPIIQPGHIEMSEPEPQHAPNRPLAMPAADFAAAAEMFKLQPAAREIQGERDAS